MVVFGKVSNRFLERRVGCVGVRLQRQSVYRASNRFAHSKRALFFRRIRVASRKTKPSLKRAKAASIVESRGTSRGFLSCHGTGDTDSARRALSRRLRRDRLLKFSGS